MLNVYPVLHVISSLEKMEDELKRIIKNGPFLEAKLKVNCREEEENKKKEEIKPKNDKTLII
jgi:hypothetical protein